MTKRLPLYLIMTLLLACCTTACNDDAETVITNKDTYANCAVKGFSLMKNDSVLAHLDSVYFAIDLVKGEIYNADSLPKGTRTEKLQIKVTTESARNCELTYRIPSTTRDTTVSIVDFPNDSVNFADGPVRMVVTAADGVTKRTYSLRVNVHESIPDTLYWSGTARRDLPSGLTAPTVQKTVWFNEKAICLTGDGHTASMASTSNPYGNDWKYSTPALPAGADIQTLTATATALYLLDNAGNLYRSADGLAWTSTGTVMHYLYGGYGEILLGARHDADGWKHVTWPASSETAVPSGCPVSGTSQTVSYETKWSSAPMVIFIGGKDASGIISGDTWAYDGSAWGKVSITGIDEREGVTLFPYMTVRVNTTNWKVSERSALLAMGGRYETDKGIEISKTVYVSYDFGITWKEADSYLQLPEAFPPFAYAQAIVVDNTMSARSSDTGEWHICPARSIPAWAYAVPASPRSRVSAAITSWECPFIYLFGGIDSRGTLHDTLWRGVINRFTFNPVY